MINEPPIPELKNLIGTERIYLKGIITFKSPFHIGAGEQGPQLRHPDADNFVLLNEKGLPYIPATSIGGVLRNLAESIEANFNIPKNLESLFGAALDNNKISNPSKLKLLHANLESDSKQLITVRNGVGIDRSRATAKKGMLYSYEIVPKGTKFIFKCELRDASKEDMTLFALTLLAFQNLPTSIGAKGGSGLGAIELEILNVFSLDLSHPVSLLNFLKQLPEFDPYNQKGKNWIDWINELQLPSHQTLKTKGDLATNSRIPQAVTFFYKLEPIDPLLINGIDAPESAQTDFEARRSERRDSEFMLDARGIDASWISDMSFRDDKITFKPFLPGSSLRGVFRSYTERILRTMSYDEAKKRASKEAETRDLYYEIVSASDPTERNSHLTSSGFALQNHTLTKGVGLHTAKNIFDSSDLGDRMWGSGQWKSMVKISEAYVSDDQWEELLHQHVAINRFTGGAADKKLFNSLPLTKASFEGSITIFGDSAWMMALIALLIKDLEAGFIRVGSHKSRGYGLVKLSLKSIEVAAVHGSDIAEKLSIKGNENALIWEKVNNPIKSNFLNSLNDEFKNLLVEGLNDLKKDISKFKRFVVKTNGK